MINDLESYCFCFPVSSDQAWLAFVDHEQEEDGSGGDEFGDSMTKKAAELYVIVWL